MVNWLTSFRSIHRCRVMRLGQSVTVPIMLSNEYSPKFAFWAAVVPFCTLAALDLGYVKPKRRRERAQKLQELRHVHAEFIANQKKEAEEAVNLLKDSTARKTKQEQEKDGLVVVEAVYGNLNAGIIADVTIAVQALVNNSQLLMPGGHSKVTYRVCATTLCTAMSSSSLLISLLSFFFEIEPRSWFLRSMPR